ncbi:hypothetical protein RHGRI_004858 [Rhododendron griersonianum]|uniref:Glycosyl transferase 48 domain-containing protein n=1 Tax=Rhododendron griersonianum TaxID=479676 RepID=A0AAV6LAZ2_9ERIC|nr:hypothetical protein RHGRI_004858 [Rhododendron griersonianum]
MDSRTEESITVLQATTGVYYWELKNPLWFKVTRLITVPSAHMHQRCNLQIRFNYNLRKALGLHQCYLNFLVWTTLKTTSETALQARLLFWIDKFLDNVGVISINNVIRAISSLYERVFIKEIQEEEHDNYLEEAMKMRNLLEEFHANHGIRPPTILGVREHVFTGRFTSDFLHAKPLGICWNVAHCVCNSRFNSTLRQGNIAHHEYIQVGKGKDVGLNQIALFEGKVVGANGEQVLSRDIYRLGQLFDFFRMLSFFFTTVDDSAYSIYFLIQKGLADSLHVLATTSACNFNNMSSQ